MHARARRSPLYVAMRDRAKDPACEACHAPLAALTDPSELAVDEGVTCEACHAIRDVEADGARQKYVFALAENRKFGPLCDGDDTYFHKMGCAKVHREARVCGGCHALSIPIEGKKELGIFTEYAEWSASNYAQTGIACQECHMPAEAAYAATGVTRKVRVGHHGFTGPGDELFRKALRIVASAKSRAGKLEVSVELKNEGAGHAVPSGLPGRQVVVRARALDEASTVQASDERAFGRVLVDDEGREVPFYLARKEGADDRIAPGKTKTMSFHFDAPRAGSLSIEVAWRSASPAITEATGVSVEERSMAKIEIPFGEASPGKERAHLPKTVTVGP